MEPETQVEAKASTTVNGVRLVGAELQAKSDELKGAPIDQVAFACGYYKEVTDTETGEKKVTIYDREYMQALLAADGRSFAPAVKTRARRINRKPTVKVGKNGNIVVGGRYSDIAGFLPPEDGEFHVLIAAEAGKIVITAYQPEEGESMESEAPESDTDDLDL
jgi:hypothetical protein